MVFYGKKVNTAKGVRFNISSFATDGAPSDVMSSAGELLRKVFKTGIKGKDI